MKKDLFKELAQSIKTAQSILDSLTVLERYELEKGWDIEHAYYSNSLSGSTIDRKAYNIL